MDVGSRGVSIHSKNYWQECVEVGFLATSLYFFSNAVLVIDEESTAKYLPLHHTLVLLYYSSGCCLFSNSKLYVSSAPVSIPNASPSHNPSSSFYPTFPSKTSVSSSFAIEAIHPHQRSHDHRLYNPWILYSTRTKRRRRG